MPTSLQALYYTAGQNSPVLVDIVLFLSWSFLLPVIDYKMDFKIKGAKSYPFASFTKTFSNYNL